MNDDQLVTRQIERMESQLADMEIAWGPNHTKLLDKLQALADLYFILNRFSEAEPLYWRIMEIKYRALGQRHPDTLMGLIDMADLYKAQNRNDEAAQYYSCAIRTLMELANECGGISPLLAKAGVKLLELKTTPQSAQTQQRAVAVAC